MYYEDVIGTIYLIQLSTARFDYPRLSSYRASRKADLVSCTTRKSWALVLTPAHRVNH